MLGSKEACVVHEREFGMSGDLWRRAVPTDDPTMRDEHLRLVGEPALSLLALLAILEPIAESFPAIDELPHSSGDS